jgi:phosphoadenosine phosphosulfate reductase
MRYILRRHELKPDEWRYLGEDEGAPCAPAALIVPLAQLRGESGNGTSRPQRLGVRVSPADDVDELAPHLARLAVVAVEFPSPLEGRGYSQGRVLRERLGFSGELRALGAGVRQDQLFLLARCGFDAFELAPGEDLEAARRALSRYDIAYQPGSVELPLQQLRFARANAPVR